MERPTVRKIMGLGWTYCPRCDQDVMVPDGLGWHCPFCGIHLVVAPSAPTPKMMVWNEALTGEELTRELTHLQAQAQRWVTDHKDMPPPKLLRRLMWFTRLVRPISWLFACQVMAIRDKKDKEVIGG